MLMLTRIVLGKRFLWFLFFHADRKICYFLYNTSKNSLEMGLTTQNSIREKS